MKNKLTVKNLVLCSMFIALSVIGAFIKPFGSSIAFDSLPAFVAASIMGPIFGAIVGALGHFVSAMIAGFAPMGIVLHLVVCVEMAIVMLVYGFLVKQVNIYVGAVVGIILNGVVATAVFIPILGMPFFTMMVGPLTLVTVINVLLAVLVHVALTNSKAVTLLTD
jgi:hypothetical protein